MIPGGVEFNLMRWINLMHLAKVGIDNNIAQRFALNIIARGGGSRNHTSADETEGPAIDHRASRAGLGG